MIFPILLHFKYLNINFGLILLIASNHNTDHVIFDFILYTINAGATKYIPIFSKITPIPYPSISDSESMSTYCSNDSDDNNGVITIFTVSLNIGFCLSKSATVGENE